jgi:FlaA1/EpsC-like NDP-sugar epimerase
MRKNILPLILSLVFGLGIIASLIAIVVYLVTGNNSHGSWIYADFVFTIAAFVFYALYFHWEDRLWPLLVMASLMLIDVGVTAIQNIIMNPSYLIRFDYFPDNALFLFWVAAFLFIGVVMVVKHFQKGESSNGLN